jgi:hypothetical protein
MQFGLGLSLRLALGLLRFRGRPQRLGDPLAGTAAPPRRQECWSCPRFAYVGNGESGNRTALCAEHWEADVDDALYLVARSAFRCLMQLSISLTNDYVYR